MTAPRLFLTNAGLVNVIDTSSFALATTLTPPVIRGIIFSSMYDGTQGVLWVASTGDGDVFSANFYKYNLSGYAETTYVIDGAHTTNLWLNQAAVLPASGKIVAGGWHGYLVGKLLIWDTTAHTAAYVTLQTLVDSYNDYTNDNGIQAIFADDANGIVYVLGSVASAITQKRTLYKINVSTATVISRIEVGGAASPSTVVYIDPIERLLIVNDFPGNLQAFDLDSNAGLTSYALDNSGGVGFVVGVPEYKRAWITDTAGSIQKSTDYAAHSLVNSGTMSFAVDKVKGDGTLVIGVDPFGAIHTFAPTTLGTVVSRGNPTTGTYVDNFDIAYVWPSGTAIYTISESPGLGTLFGLSFGVPQPIVPAIVPVASSDSSSLGKDSYGNARTSSGSFLFENNQQGKTKGIIRGVAFPFQKGILPAAAFDNELIKMSIQQILLTTRGERLMTPDFGSSLQSYLFEPNNQALRSLARIEVISTLNRNEPRIQVQDVQVYQDPASLEVVNIYISYTIRSLKQQDSLMLVINTG